jgi:F-type H+-transporting ATPase subunit b
MEALGINLGLLIVQIIAFFIVLLTLNAWVYKPFLNMLDARRMKIAQGLEDARVAAAARADAEKEAANVLAVAQTEAGKVVREATDRAANAARDAKAGAEAEAARTLASARSEAEAERNRILGDLRGQVASLAIAAAQRLIGTALDEKRQHELITEFFSGISSGKVIVLAETDLKGKAAEVTSALPLSADEQDTVRKDITGKVGAQAVTFRVDPGILGGLVIKIGDKIMDGSVSGKLEALHQTLK